MRETGEGEAGAACFEAGASLARPHAGSPWPPRLSLHTRHIDEAIPHRFLTNVFYINIILALWLSRAMHRCASGRSHAQSKGFLAVPVIKHCGVSPTSVSPFPFFVSIIWEGDMPGQCHRATVMQKIMFPVGTTLRRSKHEHVVPVCPVFIYLIYLTCQCVSKYLFCFLFSSLRKGKACHNLTGYVITVKFMLFCNLETSYSMAHLIKHLRQISLVTGFHGCMRCGGCSVACLRTKLCVSLSPNWLGSGLPRCPRAFIANSVSQ